MKLALIHSYNGQAIERYNYFTLQDNIKGEYKRCFDMTV